MCLFFRTVRDWILPILVCLSVAIDTARTGAIEIDFAQQSDPRIEVPKPVPSVTSRPLPLWIEALTAPDADLRREAADTIVLAHRLQMPDLTTAVPALTRALDAPGQDAAVIAAAARALIVLDARQTAPSLFARARAGGMELAQIVEPALARWDHKPMRSVWLDRLSDPGARRTLLFLAMDGLAAVGEKDSVPRLLEIAGESTLEPSIRLAAATALARLKSQGLEDAAEKLISVSGVAKMLDRLVAALLLSRHSSEAATQLLLRLSLDPEPSVVAVALRRLVAHDFRRILPFADRLAANDDANVRHLIAEARVAERTPRAVARLGSMLDDPHPDVRSYVRESLLTMAADSALRGTVLQSAGSALGGNQWRGLEQSAMIMVALDRKETAGRLVELLDFPRPEVFVAAAWGLRRLAVPSTCQAILRKAKRIRTGQFSRRGSAAEDRQFRHLAEALGLMRSEDATALLREYIPKNFLLNGNVRASAIWALGHLFHGKADPGIVQPLCERLADAGPVNPELPEVRVACAITLGRMRACAVPPDIT